mgnify:CR=1 FL=1
MNQMKNVMRKLLSLLLVFELFAMMPCLATQINVKMENRIQRGGKRAPSAVQFSAFYENEVVTVDLSRYYGEAQIFVYDSNGAVIGMAEAMVSGTGSVMCTLDTLPEGDCTLSIVLGSVEYIGTFDANEP